MMARMAKKEQRGGVTSEKIMELLLDMDERMATKEDLKRFATKEDLKRFATKEDLKRFATKEDLKDFVTKDDLAVVREDLSVLKDDVKEIKKDMKSLSRAFDKDAETVLRHERRITIIERNIGIAAK